METEQTAQQDELSVAEYQPSVYQNTSWPVLEGDKKGASGFKAAEFEVIASTGSFAKDPMFGDFTGEYLSQVERRAAGHRIQEERALQGAESAGVSDAAAPGETVGEAFVADDMLGEGLGSPLDSELHELAGNAVAHENHTGEYSGHQEGSQDAGTVTIAENELMQALEESYARGCADTRAEVELFKTQVEERYTVLWEDMQVQLAECIQTHERQALELAFQIAKRMVGAVADSNREYVVGVIQQALQAAGGAEIKSVRVSPQDYEFLSLNTYGEKIKVHGDNKLSFISDDTIRAGCVVETSSGQVDFDLDKAWSRLHEKVFQEPQS